VAAKCYARCAIDGKQLYEEASDELDEEASDDDDDDEFSDEF